MTTTYEPPFTDALLAQTGWLRRLVRSLVEDTAQVDDVCQATLLEAWRYRPAHDRSLRPWLASVARRLSTRIVLRERERPKREAASARSGAEASAAEVVEQASWHQTVINAVMELGEPYRATILLRYWEGASPREVARRMSVPVETVRTRLKRGLAALRESLDRRGGNRQAWFAALLPIAHAPRAFSLTAATILMTQKTTWTVAMAVTAIALGWLLWPDLSELAPDVTQATSDAPARVQTDYERTPAALAARAPVVGQPTARGITDDPQIAAALCGFRGRIVDGAGAPIADCDVVVYRHSLDRLVRPGVDFLGEVGSGPEIARAASRTDVEGRFLIDGVWPRGFYLLVANAGDRGRTLRLLERTPRPGELVDLGDIAIVGGAVLSGTVVDREGRPVPGAVVRATDLPAEVFVGVSVERFDPNGAIFVRDSSGLGFVIEVPGWVRAIWDQLPIAMTVSGADGRFRLLGVSPGANVVAVTKPGLLPIIRPRVVVERSDGERDLGRLVLAEGEELLGRVVDQAGLPVVGASILAATTSSLLEVDLATPVGTTDDEGRFAATGFARGSVTVAVRRNPDAEWVLAEPQDIATDVVVILPTQHDLTLIVTGETGQPVDEVALELLGGRRDEATLSIRRLGLIRPIDFSDRLTRANGQWSIAGLDRGEYLVAIGAPGHATALREVDLEEDRVVEVELERDAVHDVFVSTRSGRPIRNAAISARAIDSPSPMPVHCGFTDGDGYLRVTRMSETDVHVTARHPAYGAVEGTTRARGELRLILEEPSSIRGELVVDGQPPEPGAYSILLQAADADLDMTRSTPRFASIEHDGRFEFGSVQPGRYLLSTKASMAGSTTLGGLVRQMVLWNRGRPTEATVDVVAGQPTDVRLARGDVANDDRSSARVVGTVAVNGSTQPGLRARLRKANGESVADFVVDAGGRLDSGPIPAGKYVLSVSASSGSERALLYQHIVTLSPGSASTHEVNVATASLSGVIVTTDGRPVANAVVQMLQTSGEVGSLMMRKVESDANGRFEARLVPEGSYRLRAEILGDRPRFARSLRVDLVAGSPHNGIRFVMTRGWVVRGTVNLAALGVEPTERVKLTLSRVEQLGEHLRFSSSTGSAELAPDGTFVVEDLPSGEYEVTLDAGERRWKQQAGLELEADLDGFAPRLVKTR